MSSKPTLKIGSQYFAEIGKITHGGHFLTHIEGCVVFVRGAMTGEQAQVLITHKRQKVYFGVAQMIMKGSPDRVEPSCSASSVCGGCDFQFVSFQHQIVLKTMVLKDSLQRFAQLDSRRVDELVGAGVLPIGDASGLRWRGRARFRWDGSWHMHEYRSDHMVETMNCTTVTSQVGEKLAQLGQAEGLEPGEYTFAQGAVGVSVVGPNGFHSGPETVVREFAGIEWETGPRDFWQSNAALLPLVDESMQASGAFARGGHWWDLYAGVGVFTEVIARNIGSNGTVTSVEGNRATSEAARKKFAHYSEGSGASIGVITSSVERFVANVRKTHSTPDGVFLDPPRSGAGLAVCTELRELEPNWILYLACDPVALARDARELCSDGTFELIALTAWDAFPMTHHFESLAVFRNTKVS